MVKLFDYLSGIFGRRVNTELHKRIRRYRYDTIDELEITINDKPLSELYQENTDETEYLMLKFVRGVIGGYGQYVDRPDEKEHRQLIDYFPEGIGEAIPVNPYPPKYSDDDVIVATVTGSHPDYNMFETDTKEWFAMAFRFWREDVIDKKIHLPFDTSLDPNHYNQHGEEYIDKQTDLVISEGGE